MDGHITCLRPCMYVSTHGILLVQRITIVFPGIFVVETF